MTTNHQTPGNTFPQGGTRGTPCVCREGGFQEGDVQAEFPFVEPHLKMWFGTGRNHSWGCGVLEEPLKQVSF